MNVKSELKVCKNKNCQKILPEGYKHKYCEACRNQHAQAAKNVMKGFLATGTAAAGVVVAVITKGKINPKE